MNTFAFFFNNKREFNKCSNYIVPFQSTGIYSIHAEEDAIKKLVNIIHKIKKRKRTFDLCVYRLTTTKSYATSKPCVNCVHKLVSLYRKYWIKVRDVYYFDQDGKFYKNKINDINPVYTSGYRKIYGLC
jgi:deoxycytidylate deaminase